MKQKIRSELLLKRLEHDIGQKKKMEKKIIRNLFQLPEVTKAKNILLYMPIHGEVDLTAIFEQKRLNKKFILPRVNSESVSLTLYEVPDLKEIEIGAYKILEPKKRLPQIPPEKIELALIPGIAFGTDGHRIGYGKGFYDRLMKKLICPKIGIAYNFQIVNNIPGEKHDVPVNMIVTEKGITRIHTP